MQITNNQSNTAFAANFVNNKTFQDVVKYAKKNGELQTLDSALNVLNNVNKGDILIINGRTAAGNYSNFNLGKKTVSVCGGNTPEEASFKGIVELAELGKKFRRLFGGNAKFSLTTDDVISRYGK